MWNDLLKLKFVEGHRTQIAAAVIGILTILLHLGKITQEQFNTAVGFLTSIGLLAASAHKNGT